MKDGAILFEIPLSLQKRHAFIPGIAIADYDSVIFRGGTRGHRMSFPWDEWIPGALNKPQMRKLWEDGFFASGGSEPSLDHSSVDLTLTDEVRDAERLRQAVSGWL